MPPRTKKDGLPTNVYLKHEAYYFVDKSRKWHKLGKTKAEMYRNLANFSLEAPSQNTMSAVIKRYIKEELPKKSKSNRPTIERYLKEWLNYLGKMKPIDVRPMHIAKWHDKLGEKAPVSANRSLEAIRHVFSKARRWGDVDINPAKEIQRHKETPRDREVTIDEYLEVYLIASPTYQVVMEIARITGMRQRDILDLKRSDVDDTGVYNHANKNNRKLLYLMNESLKSAINQSKTLLEGAISHYIIPSKKGGKFTSSGFQTGWRRLMDKAIKEQVITERFTFHDIRSMAADLKESDKSAADLLGNTEAATRRHYRRKAKIVTPND